MLFYRRTSVRYVLVAAVIWLALMPLSGLSAQERSADSKSGGSSNATRIVLGSDAGEPSMSVTVPIYFSPSETAKIGRLKIGVRFVSRNLKFVRFENGLVAESGNLEMHTALKDEKDEQGLEYSTLEVEASQPKDGPAKAISSGLLGYITFQISKDGRPADIALRVSAEATDLETGKPIQDISGSDGKVRVDAPGSIPLVSCFFFSH